MPHNRHQSHANRRKSTSPPLIDFEATVRCSPASMMFADNTKPDCPIAFVNQAFSDMTGYTSAEAVGRNCRFLQGPETSVDSIALLREALASGQVIKLELLNYRKNGEAFWNEVQISPQVNEAGDILGFIGVLTDVTERHRLNAETAQMQSRLASILDNMPGYLFQRSLKADGALALTYCSPWLGNILGIPLGDLANGTDLLAYMHPDDVGAARQSIAQSAADLSPLLLEFRLMTPGGGVRWIRNQSTPRHTSSGAVVWDGVGLDITAEKAAEERLSYLAFHDPLTGMPNRELFATALAKAVALAVTADTHLVLFRVDLDAFDEINDELGRVVADSILRNVAKRISDFAESHDGFAARIGGDEFAVFYAMSRSDGTVQDAAAALSHILAEPHPLAEGNYAVEAGIGVADYPFETSIDIASPTAAPELMKRAALALQAAKRVGRGIHRVYVAESDTSQHNQIILRRSLRRAIEENQFKLHYHPLVDLGSGTIVGAEALVRWNHPELGLQAPDIFIPFAESSGLIVPLGGWIFKEAMQQVKAWQARGIAVPRIAINVSGVQLRDPGLLATVEAALSQTGMDASQFELELTEGFMIEASPSTLKVLRSLKMMGFMLSVDDFGTGHASFRYLRDFPVDKVKIDQTFVRQMVIDSSDASIIRAIIGLAKSLDLDVVAEGIETTVQRDFLRDEGCRVGQGYFFSVPLTAEDFGYLIERDVRLPWETSAASPARRKQKKAQAR
ncbi:putative bifunctional diguanylate cyclase/phosphodiesterase [Mesorhizobium sp. ES1-1]|uniref:putative bifunctional diguanylate cyclase/phosphodiesterase n=1 Tax=Mesorhizobium sp. ES1-1 TaxID=2876629 RepID=UPI001CCEE767|nr:EAL domain-containing protein [Mesorhizobium sp. ES1-1]MBZ9675184.1 EAL domain-containing protein [Mesorhizobium sp. ES1-1]